MASWWADRAVPSKKRSISKFLISISMYRNGWNNSMCFIMSLYFLLPDFYKFHFSPRNNKVKYNQPIMKNIFTLFWLKSRFHSRTISFCLSCLTFLHYQCKSLVVCVVFALCFCSYLQCLLDIFQVGLIKQVSLYMCWFCYELTKVFFLQEMSSWLIRLV